MRELRKLNALLPDVLEARGAECARERTILGQMEETGDGGVMRGKRQHPRERLRRDRDPRVRRGWRPRRDGDPTAGNERVAQACEHPPDVRDVDQAPAS